MRKKKTIIISIFLLLIVITSFAFIKGAIDSYNYDMDPANGVDIMEGMGAAMLIVLGGFVVFYETDLFYTVYYFFVEPKTVTRSVLNVGSNLALLLTFFCGRICRALGLRIGFLWFALLVLYVVLRTVCAVLSLRQAAERSSF